MSCGLTTVLQRRNMTDGASISVISATQVTQKRITNVIQCIYLQTIKDTFYSFYSDIIPTEVKNL